MKKLLILLVLTSSVAHAGVQCSGYGYDVTVSGSSLEVSGKSNFSSNVTKTVEFDEIYRGSVRGNTIRSVELRVSWGGSGTLVLRKSHKTERHTVSCN